MFKNSMDSPALYLLLPYQAYQGLQKKEWSRAHSLFLAYDWGPTDVEESYWPKMTLSTLLAQTKAKNIKTKYITLALRQEVNPPAAKIIKWYLCAHKNPHIFSFKHCTFSRTTSLMAGSPSGLFMLAELNWKPRRNSLSYFFFSSGLMGFHCSKINNKKQNKITNQVSVKTTFHFKLITC